jgi:hypothetical protein
MRQLHPIIRLSSPTDSPGVLFFLVIVLGVSLPNSMKIAEPWPRQTCDTALPISASKNGDATNIKDSFLAALLLAPIRF